MNQSPFQRSFSQGERPFAAGVVRGVRTWSATVRYRPFMAPAQFWESDPPITKPSFGAVDQKPVVSLVGQAGHEWQPGVNVAECRVEQVTEQDGSRGGMDPDCTCGFYAYWRYTDDHWPLWSLRGLRIVGVIEGWGRVTIGAKGFRCEKAKVLAVAPRSRGSLDGDGRDRETMARLAEVFPNVAQFDTVDAMLAEFPPDDPPEGFEDEPDTTGPHLHFATRMTGNTVTVTWTANVQAYQAAVQRVAAQLANAYAVPPHMLNGPMGIGEDPPSGEEEKRKRALDAVRNRNTGPRRTPFRRRGKGKL